MDEPINETLVSICVTEHDGMDTRTMVITLRLLKPDVDIRQAVINACTDYVQTDTGKVDYKNSCQCFNWADFEQCVPNEICRKYGFEKAEMMENDMEVDWDEHLVDDDRIPIVAKISPDAGYDEVKKALDSICDELCDCLENLEVFDDIDKDEFSAWVRRKAPEYVNGILDDPANKTAKDIILIITDDERVLDPFIRFIVDEKRQDYINKVIDHLTEEYK